MTAALVPDRVDALHLLGTDISTATTAHEGLTMAGVAGLGVHKVPVYNGSGTPIPGKYSLEDANGVPLPNVIVGDDFQVVQFEDNAAVLDAVARRTGAVLDSAGSLDVTAFGATTTRAFVSLTLPEPIMIGDDPMTAYIVALMSHGRASNFFLPTSVRVFCANQQPQITRSNIHKIVIRHTATALERTALAENTLVATVTALRDMAAEAEQMRAQAITDATFAEIIERVYPLTSDTKAAETRYDKRIDTLLDIWRGPTNANIRGTAWGAYQAIAEYDQWHRSVRVGELPAGRTLNGARARRSLTSGAANAGQIRAFEIVREMAGLTS